MAEVSSIIKDVDGNGSSKRVIAFIAIGLMGVGFIADIFLSHKVNEHIADLLQWVVLGGMGLSVAERWQPGAKPPAPEIKP